MLCKWRQYCLSCERALSALVFECMALELCEAQNDCEFRVHQEYKTHAHTRPAHSALQPIFSRYDVHLGIALSSTLVHTPQVYPPTNIHEVFRRWPLSLLVLWHLSSRLVPEANRVNAVFVFVKQLAEERELQHLRRLWASE